MVLLETPLILMLIIETQKIKLGFLPHDHSIHSNRNGWVLFFLTDEYKQTQQFQL